MPTGNAASGTAGMKMVNTSADAVPGKLLFLVKEGAIPESDDALTEALSAIGASSMEKVVVDTDAAKTPELMCRVFTMCPLGSDPTCGCSFCCMEKGPALVVRW